MTEPFPVHVQRLIDACREHRGLDPRDVLEAIEDPQWGDSSRTNDWRNHISPEIIPIWEDLSFDAKLVAYLIGASEAYFE